MRKEFYSREARIIARELKASDATDYKHKVILTVKFSVNGFLETFDIEEYYNDLDKAPMPGKLVNVTLSVFEGDIKGVVRDDYDINDL